MTSRDSIALFLRDARNDYQIESRQEAEVACKAAGYQLTVHDAENRSNKQLAQIVDVLRSPARSRLLAVLVVPVLDGMHAEVAQEAVRLGIGWVLLNRSGSYLDELRGAAPRVPVFSVAPDNLAIGQLEGEQVKHLLPGGGDVLCIVGPPTTSSARNRLSGMQACLDAGTRINLRIVRGDWSAPSGEQAVVQEVVPASRPVDLIVAQNDAMAVGARQALLQAARDPRLSALARIPVIGCDGTLSFGRQKVREGFLAATVLMPPTTGAAVKELAIWQETGRLPGSEILLPVTSFPELHEIRPQG